MHATRRSVLALGGGALAALSFSGLAHAAEPIELGAHKMPLDERAPELDRVGALAWRGGLWLDSPDKRFGGWSDLWIAPDNRRLLAISDRGWTLDAAVLFDGHLQGLRNARLGRLTAPDGKVLLRADSDAEGLARLPDGGFAVSFEQRHRILVYPPAEPAFSRPPRPIAGPNLGDTPRNGGMEALACLPGGALLALAEEGLEAGLHRGFVQTPTGWAKLNYRAAANFAPVGLCVLGDGSSIVLERSFSVFFGGFAARLVRVAAGAWGAGAAVEGVELARLRPPLLVDNYEGIAATRGPDGTTLLWFIADDNYMSLQRTLLAVFAL
ncbi:MAG: esterase-like activity of phytase family protein [Telmatospirillum sp.]|nr:esterase-like activity of phytase family protein [Telmatospirillum sp.]